MTTTRTEKHEGPRRWRPPRGLPALIQVWPESRAIPLPPSGEPVGRAWLAEHRILDPKVSSRHVVFTTKSSTVRVEDLGSTNGTSIDGVELRGPSKIENGQLLRIGATLFVYREELDGERRPDPPLLEDPQVGTLVSPFGLRAVRRAIEALVTGGARNVLVLGETGTGKEGVARAVAHAFGRADPFEIVNAAALPKELLEAEVFGYEKNSFSGATSRRVGRLERAHGGTFVLDELGALALEHQAKLLRVLEGVRGAGASSCARVVQSIGGRDTQVDVLIVGSTNAALDDDVDEGAFRRDLLARFDAPRIQIPALAERPEDLVAVANALLAGKQLALSPDEVEVEAIERLLLHDWPENVRSLRRFFDEPLVRRELPGLPKGVVDAVLGPLRRGEPTDDDVEAALRACKGNKSQAAQRLGISRGALLRRLEKTSAG